MALGFLSDPAPKYKYGLEIGGVLVAGFTSCTGLEISRATKEVAEGGVNDHIHVLPGPLQHGHVTFKRGITYTSFLWEWFHWGMNDTAVLHLPVIVILYDTSGIPIRVWPMLEAYPVKWAGEALSMGSKEAAIETLEIAFGGRQAAGGGVVQRYSETEEARLGSQGGVGEGNGIVAGSEMQRELARRVVKLMKDSIRIERERVGKAGGN